MKNPYENIQQPISSSTKKIVAISLIMLSLFLPLTLTRGLIKERLERKTQAIAEISSKLGGAQVITGPVVTVPYKASGSLQYRHVLPETLTVNATVNPQVRHRGLFEAVIYDSQCDLQGAFDSQDFKIKGVADADILWDQAFVSLGISSLKGISGPIKAEMNGKTLRISPGSEKGSALSSRVGADVNLAGESGNIPFRIKVSLTGTQMLEFVPVGRSTFVEMKSTWPNPSFCGAFLPEHRTVKDQGFTAKWHVMDYNRSYPQSWTGHSFRPMASAFGVNLFQPVDVYTKSDRTTKYGILFVVFTFAAFFIAENLAKVRLHPIQYLFGGLCVTMFYVLVLSLSEHLSFGLAYLISGVAVVALVSVYCSAVLKKQGLAWAVGGVLAILYSYFYLLLLMEDYALLAGSTGLFLLLALIMLITRKVDWYAVSFPGGAQVQGSARDEGVS